MRFLQFASLLASSIAIAINLKLLIQRYNREQAKRVAAGAPKDFWAVMRGRGFYKDELGWHNE